MPFGPYDGLSGIGALSLDDSNGSALTSLCAAHWMLREYEQGVEECQRAVTVDPNSSNGYLELSDALTIADRPQEAARAAEKAMRLDPTRASFYAYFIAAPHILMGRYREAVPLLKEHIADYPNQQWARAQGIELKCISPQFSTVSSKDTAVTKRWQNDLRRAGVG